MHSGVGDNGDIPSKIAAFSQMLEKLKPVDIALLKFCWYDFTPEVDTDGVLGQYQKSIELLKQRHPETKFIHVTVPLTSNDRGLKAGYKSLKDVIKQIVGKANYFDNAARCRYNKRLLEIYSGKEPILDLARLESTLPDGSQVASGSGDKRCASLAPEYTDDAGHLNQYGGKIVGEQFLVFLANWELSPSTAQ